MKKTTSKKIVKDAYNTPVKINGKVVGYAVAKYAKNVQSLLNKKTKK